MDEIGIDAALRAGGFVVVAYGALLTLAQCGP